MGTIEITFPEACDLLGRILRGSARRRIIETAGTLPRLRENFRSQVFRAGSEPFNLNPIVKTWDSQVPMEGFHVLHDWNGVADKHSEEPITVDVLDYFIGLSPEKYSAATAMAVMLDYHFAYILALLAVNAWDDGDPNENLERISNLLADLQGPGGSAHQFAANAETLILIATSHFEPDRNAYETLLDRVRGLDAGVRLRLALAHAAFLGSHLRHGFQDLYMRDLAIMRDDNGPDYPWLLFAVATLMTRYSELCDRGIRDAERDVVVEGLINGLSPDPRALIGTAPSSLRLHEREHAEFRSLVGKYKTDLLEDFETHRPSDQVFSPLALSFNFPHNMVKGIVASAIVHARPAPVPVNALLTGIPHTPDLELSRKALVLELTAQARWRPDIIRGRPVPIFSYDHFRGVRDFVKTVGVVRNFAYNAH